MTHRTKEAIAAAERFSEECYANLPGVHPFNYGVEGDRFVLRDARGKLLASGDAKELLEFFGGFE